MKRLYTIIVTCFMVLAMVSCGNSPKSTIANLKAAIDGESMASAKYASFAVRAQEEGFVQIAALFRATSKAESIHARNHNEVLVGLGEAEYVPEVADIIVGTTVENLQVALLGEIYEFEHMYPDFIAVAQKEGVPAAVDSYTFANDTEKAHAALYKMAIVSLEGAFAMPATYYVCSVCGDTFGDDAPQSCPICHVGSDQFLVYAAQVQSVGQDVM